MANAKRGKNMDDKYIPEDQTKIEVKINKTKASKTADQATPTSVDDLIAINVQEPSKTSPKEDKTNESLATNPSHRGLIVSALAVVAILSVSLLAVIKSSNTPDKAKIVKARTATVATVESTSQGFIPATVVVKKGTVVSWTGPSSTSPVIIASNPYPNDNKLSTLKSSQLSSGASYRYKFNDSGTFTYHDDLNPNNNGTIIVE